MLTLRGAVLMNADLRGADLAGADLMNSNLAGAKTDKRYISISCIGSSKRMVIYCFDNNKIWSDYFNGTLEEFEERVKETHSSNGQYLKEYLGAINYIKSLI